MNERAPSLSRRIVASAVLALGVLVSGCGTLPGGRGWGQDAIYPVKWERVKTAARNAVTDPVTWITAGGAAVFAIDDFDDRVSDWAIRHTPVFGDPESADDASDTLLTLLRNETYITAFLTPSGNDPLDWTTSKARGLGVEYAAIKITDVATGAIKSEADRLRPDGTDRRSFPSGHASSAFASVRLSNRNLDAMQMPDWTRTSLKTGNYIAASATAWARVEAGQHHPSDVLAGACLGNILTTFIHDAFMNLPEEERSYSFYIEPTPRSVIASVSWEF